MVEKNNEEIIYNLIKIYDFIISKLYDIYPAKLESLKDSWEISLSKYKQILKQKNIPLSKLKSGLLQGLCEIPFILQSILTSEELNKAYSIYLKQIEKSKIKNILYSFFYKIYLNIIKKGSINNTDEFWMAQLIIDLYPQNSTYLNKIDIEELMELVDDFNSKL